MNAVTLFDAKNRLSALIDQVETGEEVTITRRGKPVARIVPVVPDADRARHAAEGLLALRAEIAARAGGFTHEEILSFRDEGRR
jgi:prevent-host-death family protein